MSNVFEGTVLRSLVYSVLHYHSANTDACDSNTVIVRTTSATMDTRFVTHCASNPRTGQ